MVTSHGIWEHACTCVPVHHRLCCHHLLVEFIQLLLQKDDFLIIIAQDSLKNLRNFLCVSQCECAGLPLFFPPCSQRSGVARRCGLAFDSLGDQGALVSSLAASSQTELLPASSRGLPSYHLLSLPSHCPSSLLLFCL